MKVLCLTLSGLLMLLAAVLWIRNNVTFRQREKVINAIHAYSMKLIEEHRWKDIQVDLDDMEPYSRTMLRLWDWGPTRILPPEKYEIIKPYIEEAAR